MLAFISHFTHKTVLSPEAHPFTDMQYQGSWHPYTSGIYSWQYMSLSFGLWDFLLLGYANPLSVRYHAAFRILHSRCCPFLVSWSNNERTAICLLHLTNKKEFEKVKSPKLMTSVAERRTLKLFNYSGLICVTRLVPSSEQLPTLFLVSYKSVLYCNKTLFAL